jgi:hypothetical protein
MTILTICADTILGMVGAIINGINLSVLNAKPFMHPSGQDMKLLLTVVATANTSLVSYDDNAVSKLPTGADKSEDSWHKLKVVSTMNITPINIDDAIAVKKQGGDQHEEECLYASSD